MARMIAKVLLASFLGLAACGGSESDSSLNPAFAGTWTGTTTVAFDGLSAVSYSGVLAVSVAGQQAMVTLVCPDGSGSLIATGSGNTASWTGTLNCPPIPFAGCSAVYVTFQSATGSLNGGTLTVQARGYGTGCSTTRNGSSTFIGTKL